MDDGESRYKKIKYIDHRRNQWKYLLNLYQKENFL